MVLLGGVFMVLVLRLQAGMVSHIRVYETVYIMYHVYTHTEYTGHMECNEHVGHVEKPHIMKARTDYCKYFASRYSMP